MSTEISKEITPMEQVRGALQKMEKEFSAALPFK